MSEFDKEAEREKLREKFEKEEKDREATQRMSELLLKGATMTNIHCDVCGDPIFRSDDQEFCPTCQKPVVQEDETEPQNATSQSQQSQEELDASLDDEESVDIQINGATTPTAPDQDQSESQPDTEPAQPPTDHTTQNHSEPGSLGNSREYLLRIITTSIQTAAESNDVQRSRDNLQLAKDAAETLRTLQGL